ncbi:DUF3524 domain-containing protein [Marinicella sp. S1101]|uniref:tRNA-queuosine alpha-mannosyltransferase domain-containing protein n=1 Tax=Marinicella marina TaxID=2996016 RepID=UPI002260C516|nr:DUF3524 domain-containing protein [Marinicella marina]MCX7553294.1 DUF3524 domain-containing protein [Marinicella marina]MDJ1139026.1 DUF3524 domain-containing protein [Marinicella marina]
MHKPRILLISAYDAQSHRYWHQQLISGLPQFKWQLLTLKDRYFSWRMGGNAMSFQQQSDTELSADYDVVLATSMTDLSTLLALYPHLNPARKLLYFHENQFAYPVNNKQQGLAEMQLRSIYAAMVADVLVFNSQFNRDSFISGVGAFIKKMPDGTPADLPQRLKAKAQLLPVPIRDDARPIQQQTDNNKKPCLEVIWNHRWEHDKGPETLLELLRLCRGHEQIKFHILGQQFKQTPPAMQSIIDAHRDQCLNLGYVEDRDAYLAILQRADVVLSTAQHDFQGIAMLEAVACGCLPVAPDRLVYPEYYPPENLYPSATPKQQAQSILALLLKPQNLAAAVVDLGWQKLKPMYADLLGGSHAE